MSNKVAKIVDVTISVRVIVDENATDDQVLEACKPKVQFKSNNIAEWADHEVFDDIDLPYDLLDTDDNPDMQTFRENYLVNKAALVIALINLKFSKEEIENSFDECVRKIGYVYYPRYQRWLNKDYNYTEAEQVLLEAIKAEVYS